MSSTGSSVSTSGLVLPSTPLAEPGKEVPLVVNTPSRAKPPRHWIDLSIEERVQAVKDFGVPAFRARQISAHVFERGRSTRLSGLTCLRRPVRRSPTPGFRSC